ncbi:MAG: hypothetical protein NZ837_15225, partial [Gammaproteobacteria bacterium]|nr:hypothetical protein [Gammaproteobacteria bacterium]
GQVISRFNIYLRRTANILLLSFPACGRMHSRIQYSLVVFQEALFHEKIGSNEIRRKCFE